MDILTIFLIYGAAVVIWILVLANSGLAIRRIDNRYPDCKVEFPLLIGNGKCNRGSYNSEACGWDGGDCDDFQKKYPGCNVKNPMRVGDGKCDGGDYNIEECAWDGGDCDEFKLMYPDCNVETPTQIGNGRCNLGEYNTEKCGWDEGDCDAVNEKDSNRKKRER